MDMDLAALGQRELIPAERLTATGNGDGVDISDYNGRAKVLLSAQNQAGTDPTLDVKLQESDDDGDTDAYADIDGAAFTQVTDAAASFQELNIDTRNTKKYIRAVRTIGGTDTPSFDVACVIVLQKQYRG